MDAFWDAMESGLGLGLTAEDLGGVQMMLRAVVVYVTTVAMVKVGRKRFMGKNAAFDVILGIVLGSVVSRAITGNAPLGPTLLAGLALVLVHWAFALIAFHSHRFGVLVKGNDYLLAREGELDWETMRHCQITERDLLEAARYEGHVTRVEDIHEARFERSGHISVIPRERAGRVVEVRVADGVQTVRIEVA